MAFKAGNRSRKKESVQDTVKSIDLPLEYCVGYYTRKIEKCCIDRLRAAVYYHRHPEESEKLYDDEDLEKEIANIRKEDIAKEILPILQTKDYCFNPIIRKIFAGEITDFVAYPYPVKCRLELTKDEKELLIDINNFKCSFMEDTMGNLYLSTKIVLTKDVKIPEGESDLLGFYTKRIFTNPDQVEPEVWLLINKIEAESCSLGCDRKFVLAKVYIHEMMHRYYDMHPELLLKKSVKEIEEPMAELATIEFCREFCKEHKEYSELINVAIKQTQGLKATNNYFYALGADLFDLYKEEKKRHSLIDIYRHVCMMMHEQNKEVKAYLNLVRDPENIKKYQERDEGVKKQFCKALIDC